MRTDEFEIESSVTMGCGYSDPIVVAFDVEYDSAAFKSAAAPKLGLDVSHSVSIALRSDPYFKS